MGTIIARKRKDGTTGYTAQIVRKSKGDIIWSEAKTFDRKQAAVVWLQRRETELSEPGAMERKDDPPLRDVIDQYIAESEKVIGRTKAQVLRSIKEMDVAELRCSKITSSDLVAMVRALKVEPSTRQNYLSHLGAVFSIARPAWGYPLSQEAMADAFKVTGKLGLTGKSKKRDRRPTLAELDKLIRHFEAVRIVRPTSIPMRHIICFAIFSTRRQDEITRLRWEDFDRAHKRILVRDMKHPGDKAGNNVWCNLTTEAMAFIKAQPKTGEFIFPYSTESISAAFTRACKTLGIEDLHFHDLRHEGAEGEDQRHLDLEDAGNELLARRLRLRPGRPFVVAHLRHHFVVPFEISLMFVGHGVDDDGGWRACELRLDGGKEVVGAPGGQLHDVERDEVVVLARPAAFGVDHHDIPAAHRLDALGELERRQCLAAAGRADHAEQQRFFGSGRRLGFKSRVHVILP